MLVLTFNAAGEPVGVDIRRVREVIPRVHVKTVTGSPAWLAGVFVYHGRVVPVVDLHRLTGHTDCPLHLSSRIILLPLSAAHGGALVGLLASQVADLKDVTAPPAPVDPPAADGIDLGPLVADDRGVIRLLDPDRLFPADARRLLLTLAGGGA
jgi:chemotaxis-related protein WspB